MKKEIFKEKCFYFVMALFITTVCLLMCTNHEISKTKKLVEEVEYYDSLNNYNKVYYNRTFNTLKKVNRELYDSLKDYKNQIEFLVQFSHEQQYNTGVVTITKTKHDTVFIDKDIEAKLPKPSTFEYTSEPNDTFTYKLKVNSIFEPNWYSLSVNTKNQFTIVNKQDEPNGPNHITIGSNNGGIVSNVTVFHKEQKRKVADRIAFGPTVNVGYDPINKQWGTVVGVGITFDVKWW